LPGRAPQWQAPVPISHLKSCISRGVLNTIIETEQHCNGRKHIMILSGLLGFILAPVTIILNLILSPFFFIIEALTGGIGVF
jgi:hypothetical protein